jgi:hypothetical protein
MPEGSNTLTKQEKDAIRKICGNMSSPLFQTVAKLYVCPRSGNRWIDSGVWGAMCLVIDRSMQPPAYMIQILDLQNYAVQFSHELSVGCVYNCSDALFHSFEIDNGFVGFSFVNVAEARDFGQKVLSAIPKRDPGAPIAPLQKSAFKSLVTKASMAAGLKLPGVQQGMNIGVPTDFVHTQHITYNAAVGFECTNIPEAWKSLFRSLRIKKADLQCPETASKIYADLQKELGADFLQNEPPVPPPLPKKGAPKTRVVVEEVPACPAAPDAPPAPPGPPTAPAWAPVAVRSSPRGDLMAQITGGFQLKPVNDEEKTATVDLQSAEDTAMEILVKNLAKRFDVVQAEEADSDVDDDWD